MAKKWRGTKVESVRILHFDEDGELAGKETYRRRSKKGVSKPLRKHERNTRRLHKALVAYVDEKDRRHQRSNKKRRNGYLRDWFYNDVRALRKAEKHLRKMR